MTSVAIDAFRLPLVRFEGKEYDTLVACVDRHSGWIVGVPFLNKGMTGPKVAKAMLEHQWRPFFIPSIFFRQWLPFYGGLVDHDVRPFGRTARLLPSLSPPGQWPGGEGRARDARASPKIECGGTHQLG